MICCASRSTSSTAGLAAPGDIVLPDLQTPGDVADALSGGVAKATFEHEAATQG